MKKKNNYVITFLVTIIFIFNFNLDIKSMENKTFYDFKIESITGEMIDFNEYKGKTILLVNVASNCGFTKQYNELQKLWDMYKEKNLIVIGVPSNQFGNQEPGSNEEINKFCKVNFNISFPMTSKYDVKGNNAHEIYRWAKETYGKSAIPKWNFHKILINKNGYVQDTFASFTKPMSNKVIKVLEKIL